jgi:hypothetical protein
MESVQLLLLLQQIFLSPTFPVTILVILGSASSIFPANQVDLPAVSHWRIFVDIFLTASRNTHTQTHVANYLVCVCLAVLRSTTIGTGKLTPDLAPTLTNKSPQSFISNKISDLPQSCSHVPGTRSPSSTKTSSSGMR